MLRKLAQTLVRGAREHSAAVLVSLFLLLVPRFRLGIGRPDADEINLLTHLARFLFFWRVDLKLPPRANTLYMIYLGLFKHGIWRRHLIEKDLMDANGVPAFHFMLPLNRHNPLKIGFMTVGPHNTRCS